MTKIVWKVLTCSCLAIGACSASEGGGTASDGGVDASNNDSIDVDASDDDDATTDALLEDSLSADVNSDVFTDVFTGDASLDDWVIRKPESVQCKVIEKDPMLPDPGEYETWLQMGIVCTFSYNGINGLIYVVDTPLECKHTSWFGRPVTKSKTEVALIKVGDQVDYLENAMYEYGGQHMRDRLTFDFRGVRFVYSHVCNVPNNQVYAMKNPNCAIIKDTSGKMLDNGCTPERTRPIVCKEVDKNGNYDETMKDDYHYTCGLGE